MIDPITAGIVGGAAQGIIGGIRTARARKQMKNMIGNSPTYGGSSAISDYYNKALNEYSANPFNTAQYQAEVGAINRNLANVGGLATSRRMGANAVTGLFNQANNAYGQALARAEANQMQKLGQLGSASQMLGADQMQQFEINELMPYQQQLNYLNAQATGGGQVLGAGLSNIFSGLQSRSMMNMLNQYYNSGNNG